MGWVKQLQLNPTVARPVMQKQKHAQTTTFQCLQVGKVEDNNPCVGLPCYRIAQSKRGVTVNNSAVTINDSHICYSLDLYVRHSLLLQSLRCAKGTYHSNRVRAVFCSGCPLVSTGKRRPCGRRSRKSALQETWYRTEPEPTPVQRQRTRPRSLDDSSRFSAADGFSGLLCASAARSVSRRDQPAFGLHRCAVVSHFYDTLVEPQHDGFFRLRVWGSFRRTRGVV